MTTLVALFADLPLAMQAVSALLTSGHLPSAIEFMDHQCLELVGDLLPFDGVQESKAFLLVETDGAPGVIEREMEQMGEICLEYDPVNVFLAPDSHRRAQMWEVRRQVSLRIEEHAPVYIPEDVVVPIGRIAEFIGMLPELAEAFGMKIYSFGHAGDGNIHLNITAESRDVTERVEDGIRPILKLVLSMGGTISGEHGIGFVKKGLLPLDSPPKALSAAGNQACFRSQSHFESGQDI